MKRFLRWLDRLIWSKLDINIRIDGDLVTPASPDDPWWYTEIRR